LRVPPSGLLLRRARSACRDIGRDLGVVLGARVLLSAARALATVIAALYLSAVGFSALRIGETFLVMTAVAAALSVAVGSLTDRIDQRVLLVATPLLLTAGAFMLAYSAQASVLVAAVAIGSVGRGQGAGGGSVGPHQPAESSYVTAIVPARRRNSAFATLAVASSTGALLGGLLAGTARPTGSAASAAAAAASYRPAFLVVAGLAAAAGLLALALRRAPRAGADGGRTGPRAGADGGRAQGRGERDGRGRRRRGGALGESAARVVPWKSRRVLWRMLLTNSTNGLATVVVGPLFSYWLHTKFGASPGEIGVVYAAANGVSIAGLLLASPLARRMGSVKSIVALRATQGLLLLPLAFAPTFAFAGVVFAVRQLAQRLGLPLRKSYVQGVADESERGRMAAWSNLPSQGVQAGGHALVGYLFQEASLAAPFVIGAGAQLLNASLWAGLLGPIRPPEERGRRTERRELPPSPSPGGTAVPSGAPARGDDFF
jgi:MFS family permease